MNDVTSADISEERENSEATSEDFVENLEIKNVKNELEDKYQLINNIIIFFSILFIKSLKRIQKEENKRLEFYKFCMSLIS